MHQRLAPAKPEGGQRLRWKAALGVLVIGLALTRPASANPHLEVRGSSRFDAQARPSNGELVVFGFLLDDAGHALADADMSVAVTAPNGTPVAPRACDAKTALGARPDGAWGLTTRPDGSFCVRARPPYDRANSTSRIDLTWAGAGLVDGASSTLSVDPSRSAVSLALDPEPRVLMLGQAPIRLSGVARVLSDDSPEGRGGHVSPSGLTLTLSDERGRIIAEETTDAAGEARFVVDPASLGLPGPGEMRLSFAGTESQAPASRVATCQRRTRVRVAPRGATEVTDLERTIVDDGVEIDLDVTTALGAPVPGGSVEGLIDGAVEGAAPASHGRAHLVVRWPEAGRRKVMLRYVPDVSWYLAGEPLAVTVTVAATPLWRSRTSGVVVAGLAMLVLFFRLRGRTPVRRRRTVAKPELVSTLHPRLDVVAPKPDGPPVWEGQVVDAHDGQPVAGASISLERAGFTGAARVAATVADAGGAFRLEVGPLRPGDRLSVEGRLHERFTRSAPGFGVVAVALVSRRRALLARFVRWARAKGAPFDLAPEPTPEHVKRVAAAHSGTVRWAGAVEAAAFGPADVDARVEAEVNILGHEKTEGPP